MGTAWRRSIGTRRANVTAADAVPTTLASLFVATEKIASPPGSTIRRAESCTTPPPPTTASTAPASSDATQSASSASTVTPPKPGHGSGVVKVSITWEHPTDPGDRGGRTRGSGQPGHVHRDVEGRRGAARVDALDRRDVRV